MRFYIDPGTGSMLFAILIGIIGAVTYMLKSWLLKLRFVLSGGKKVDTGAKKIPLVIFSDDKRYWSVFSPVCRELDKKGIDTVYMTASPDDPALENDFPHIHAQFIEEGNKAFAKLNFLNASVVLATTPGLDVYQWKRSKQVDYYVHLPHAASDISGYRMFGIDYYDAILLSGQYQVEQVRALEKLRALPAKEIVKVGIPYMDDMLARLHADPPLPEHERTVLLAPSWGESAILKKYGGRIIDTLLATGYHIIIRPHPQSRTAEAAMLERLQKKYPDGEKLSWNFDNDNFDVLNASDIMISDFSGVIFDYAFFFDRPILYADTEFNTAPYDAAWLEEKPWTPSVVPLIGRKLEEIIDGMIHDTGYAESRRKLCEEAWPCRGKAAENIVDYLTEKRTQLCEARAAAQKTEET